TTAQRLFTGRAACGPERRHETEQERRRAREAHGERQYGAVDGEVLETGKVTPEVGRHERGEQVYAEQSEQDAAHATGEREHHALDQGATRDARTRPAERDSDAELATSTRRAGEHQVRDVGAHDEEHE